MNNSTASHVESQMGNNNAINELNRIFAENIARDDIANVEINSYRSLPNPRILTLNAANLYQGCDAESDYTNLSIANNMAEHTPNETHASKLKGNKNGWSFSI